MLFDDTEIFASGNRGRMVFDLPDAEVMLIDKFFTKQESDFYYREFLEGTDWREYEMEIFDKTVTVPRLISWNEEETDENNDKKKSDWNPHLLAIRKRVEKETALRFNAVLLNLYRNGKDGVAWHSDRIDRSGKDPIIASVSFGETRMFSLRHKFRKEQPQVDIPLHHGSFLLMAGTTNSFWQHQVPKTAKNILPRINLTFRIVLK